MNKKLHISSIFPSYLFWDMDINKLDLESDKDIIIPRALYASNKDSFNADINKLEEIYSQKDILDCLKKTRELISNDVCEMIAKKYHTKIFYRFQK